MIPYRQRYYDHYSQVHLNRSEPLSPREERQWRRIYSYYLRGWLPPDRSAEVLDLGCGPGNLLAALKLEGYRCLRGLEQDPAQVALARNVVPDVEAGDAMEFLTQNPGRWDLITALDLIEHFTKEETFPFLDACFQALRPGGRLILQTPNGESPWVGSVAHGDFTHEQCFTPHGLEKVLTVAGFRGIEARPCGPPPVTGLGALRYALWQGITLGCRILNRIEGAVSCGIYTRVFLIRGLKPGS